MNTTPMPDAPSVRTLPPLPLHRRHATLGLLACLALGLGACSPEDKDAKGESASVPLEQSYTLLAHEGRGFSVGAMMTANTVYVLFDPQCPHCGHLWQASLPLHKKVKFVWMPVAFIGAQSAPQGAALLAAENPVEAMSAHEASLLAGTGGTAASSSIPDDIAQAIKKNTALFNRLGGESVPFVVAKNQRTGAVVNYAGAMDTAALEQFLGLQ